MFRSEMLSYCILNLFLVEHPHTLSTEKNIFYYLRLRELETFWRRREEGGRKSFRMDELDRSFFLEGEQGVLVPYLEGLQKDLLTRD